MTLGLSWNRCRRHKSRHWMINRCHHCGRHHKAHSEWEYRAVLQHIWSAGNGHVWQCVSTFSSDVSKLSCNFYKVSDITESTSVTYVSELHEPQFSKLTDAVVCRPRLQKQLGQTHLFTPEQGAHFDSSLRRLSSSRRRANISKLTRTVLPSVWSTSAAVRWVLRYVSAVHLSRSLW